MMWWHWWFMAASFSVCFGPSAGDVRPNAFPSLVPSSLPRPGLWFLTWFSHVQNIAGPPACDDSFHCFFLCPCWTFRAGGSDVWDGEVRLKDSLAIYWPAWEQRLDVWVYWFPARNLWVIQSRQESIEIFFCCCCWKAFKNVLLLRQTENPSLINKALLLNKTAKDTSFNISCVQSV